MTAYCTIMGDLPTSDIARSGLCATCVHLKLLRSQRESVFFFCLRSESDPRFTRYPPVPVLRCDGHETQGGAATLKSS